MEEKKEFLTEKNYEKGKRFLKRLALIILALGLLIGGSLIATGIIKSSKVGSSSAQKSEETIQSEIDSLNAELATLKAQRNQEFKTNGSSEDYYNLGNEIQKKQQKVNDLEHEIWKEKSGYNSTSDSISRGKYIPLYMIGAFIIISSCMFAVLVFVFSKRREILAFQAQQIMPVAQEGIEKMSPTIGNTVKEISKGIKEGINEADNNK